LNLAGIVGIADAVVAVVDFVMSIVDIDAEIGVVVAQITRIYRVQITQIFRVRVAVVDVKNHQVVLMMRTVRYLKCKWKEGGLDECSIEGKEKEWVQGLHPNIRVVLQKARV
jgi:hypothetical protein